MLIDTHAHLNFNAFKDDAGKVIKECLKKNIWMINVGSQYETSKRAVYYAEKHQKGVYAAIGLHPIHAIPAQFDIQEMPFLPASKASGSKNEHPPKLKAKADIVKFKSKPETFKTEKYKALAQSKKVVAIGEIGLDYAVFAREQSEWKQKRASAEAQSEGEVHQKQIELYKQTQIQAFKEQIVLAQELRLPIIIHCRNAWSDLLIILTQYYGQEKIDNRKQIADNNCRFSVFNSRLSAFKPQPKTQDPRPATRDSKPVNCLNGVAHFFSGSLKNAQKLFDLGFLISFTGVITFTKDYDKIIRKTPLCKLLLETDCPYVAPKPFRGKRNLPLYVKYVAEKIAAIKNVSPKEVAHRTTENAKKLFRL